MYCVTRGWILGLCWDKNLKSFHFWYCGLKQVFNVNIVFGNLESENSQDYAQKPQQNCKIVRSLIRFLFKLAYVNIAWWFIQVHWKILYNTMIYIAWYLYVLYILYWNKVYHKIFKHMFGSSRESNLKNTCLFNFLENMN